jgi:uncharacterized integral membrane protein (TIGR00698 family)
MSSTVAVPRFEVESPFSRIARLLPGVTLLAAVGYAGKVLERTINTYAKSHHLVIPNVEYVLWAIVIGLTLSNLLTIPKIFADGISTYEFWLRSGIVLLGARFAVGDLVKLGGLSLGLVVLEICGSLAFMTLLGRVFKLRPKLTTLLAVGSSVCGVSAIIATQGAIDADEEDASFAIAAILALGAIALVFFPLIGHALNMSDNAYGLWTGLAVDNTAEATAAGALYSDAAGKIAVLAKTCRNAMIGFVVLGYAIYWAKRGQASGVEKKASFLWQKFPKFVLGFLVVSVLVSAHTFTKTQVTALANLSRWAFLLTFAGVGLRTNIREMFKQGLRPFVAGAVGEVAIAVLTLGLVVVANRFWGL